MKKKSKAKKSGKVRLKTAFEKKKLRGGAGGHITQGSNHFPVTYNPAAHPGK